MDVLFVLKQKLFSQKIFFDKKEKIILRSGFILFNTGAEWLTLGTYLSSGSRKVAWSSSLGYFSSA